MKPCPATIKYFLILILIQIGHVLNGQLFCNLCSVNDYCTNDAYITPNPPISPLTKPGWNLIFNDEFNSGSLDVIKWNKSTNTDDGYHNCLNNIVLNPANVSVTPDGYLKLTLNSTDYAGCTHSGAEIKTYSTQDPNFKSFSFYPDSYIEIRVKNLPFSGGAGSAFWLFRALDPYREIDIWETYAGETNLMKSNYHWDEAGIDSKTQSIKYRLFKTTNGQPLNLDQGWVVFGCEWHSDKIYLFINYILVRVIDLTTTNAAGEEFGDINWPFNIRLDIQSPLCSSPMDEAALPKNMYVDYVRVYKQQGTYACPYLQSTGEICSTDGAVLTVPYYPYATYTWDNNPFAALNYAETDNHIANERWITLNPGFATNHSYNATVTVTFPEGYTETITKSIYVSASPVAPTGSIGTLQIGSLCEYYGTVTLNASKDILYYSNNNGLTWDQGTTYQSGLSYKSKFGDYMPSHTYTVLLKSINACGTSTPSLPRTFTTPAPPYPCLWKEASSDSTIGIIFSNGWIQIDHPEGETFDIEIYNIQGQSIFNISATTEHQHAVPVLNPGIYIIVVRDNNNNFAYKREIFID